jgi:hypothetical protein
VYVVTCCFLSSILSWVSKISFWSIYTSILCRKPLQLPVWLDIYAMLRNWKWRLGWGGLWQFGQNGIKSNWVTNQLKQLSLGVVQHILLHQLWPPILTDYIIWECIKNFILLIQCYIFFSSKFILRVELENTRWWCGMVITKKTFSVVPICLHYDSNEVWNNRHFVDYIYYGLWTENIHSLYLDRNL